MGDACSFGKNLDKTHGLCKISSAWYTRSKRRLRANGIGLPKSKERKEFALVGRALEVTCLVYLLQPIQGSLSHHQMVQISNLVNCNADEQSSVV